MKAHIALFVAAIALDATTADRRIPELLQEDREYSVLPGHELETWGWDLPDGGRHVKALADAAPGGAFDPRGLESIRSADLGYRARWRVLRYTQYGLDWDITGLQLTPVNPEPGLPTLAIIHGGSANWYEFFVDPLNRAGLGQFLAEHVHFRGWSHPEQRRRLCVRAIQFERIDGLAGRALNGQRRRPEIRRAR